MVKELGRTEMKLFIVDYYYNGSWYSGYVPGTNICDVMNAIKAMSEILPEDVSIEIDFAIMPVLLTDIDIDDEEIQGSLISYFLYHFRNTIDISKYKDQMITYFEDQNEFEKCAVLLNYSTPESARF